MVEQLTERDYFRYSAPFRQWLWESLQKQLSDYKTADARRLFGADFVPVWNAGRLPKRFYEEGPALKTSFAALGRPSRAEEEFGFSREEAARLFAHSLPKPAPSATARQHGPIIREFATEDDRIAYQKQQRMQEQANERSLRRRRAEDLEELVPKKEGRAREIERRHERGAYARAEKNAHDVEVDEKGLLGGRGGADYEAALGRRRELEARRDDERQRRAAERDAELSHKRQKHEEHEQKVQSMFRELLKQRK